MPRRSGAASAVLLIAVSMAVAPSYLAQPEEVPFVDVASLAFGYHERRRRMLDDRRTCDLVAGLQKLHLPERRGLPASLPIHVAGALVGPSLRLCGTDRLLDDARFHLLYRGEKPELEDLVAGALVARHARVDLRVEVFPRGDETVDIGGGLEARRRRDDLQVAQLPAVAYHRELREADLATDGDLGGHLGARRLLHLLPDSVDTLGDRPLCVLIRTGR